MKILLLEDDVALNRAIKKVTELDKHTTQSYLDGQDVLDNMVDSYDLYILDINVPHINGLELLDIIYTKNNESKVIIISANTDINSLEQAYKLGCIDYLKKPFHLQELRMKIDRLNIVDEDFLSNIKLREGSVLTKKEKQLLILLLKNTNSVVTYEMIEESVYKDKSMSMDSLRALVRRLRLKLADDIIRNILEEGYQVAP
ncbi:MAG: response regulator [Campylobacterota bacterium]|nr:response regulator [Campylobacterota bacterium]